MSIKTVKENDKKKIKSLFDDGIGITDISKKTGVSMYLIRAVLIKDFKVTGIYASTKIIYKKKGTKVDKINNRVKDKIKVLFAEGKTIDYIVNETNTSIHLIRKILKLDKTKRVKIESEIEEQIITFLNEGKTIAHIAGKTQFSMYQIRKIKKKLKINTFPEKIEVELKEKIQQFFDEGKTITCIAKEINTSIYQVRKTLKVNKKGTKVNRIKKEQRKEIKELFDNGQTISSISITTNISGALVRKILKEDYNINEVYKKVRIKTNKEKILHDYFNKLSITELQLKYNVSKYIIYKILKENNIEIPINERSKRYNRFAMKVFKKFDKRNNTKGLYGRDEFYIEKYRYYLDYINLDLKLIIEWDEEQHKYKKKEDKIREENIKQELPDFTFKRVDELDVINTINNLFLSE